MSKKRIRWVDYGKGIAIILVVLHHSMFSDLYSVPISNFDSIITQLRMPFFFFIAGLFIHKALFSDLKSFLKSKVALFLYLYILWSIIRYLTDTLPRYFVLNDKDVNLASILHIFVEPPATLWFIYALLIFFIVARLTRSLPIITLSISLLVFAFATQSGEYEFIHKVARFFPIFILGYLTSSKVIALAEKIKVYHIVIPIAFLLFSSQVQGTSWTDLALNSFLLSLFGIASGIVIANLLTRAPGFSFLEYIGKNTLVIYVLHFLPLNILKVVLPKVMPNSPEIGVIIMVIAGVTIPLLIGGIAKRLNMNWLFELPTFTKN